MQLFATHEEATEGIDFARWLDRGIVAAVLLTSTVALSYNKADPDLWGHVQYGRDALAYGLPLTTTYSYAAVGYPWINHEILAEYALAIGADWFGGAGLLVGKAILGALLIGAILWRGLRPEAGLIPACGLALLVAITLGGSWTLRPQLASYACFALLLALLSYCFAGWEGRCQWPRLYRFLRGEDQPDELPPLEYSSPRLKLLWLAPLLFMVWTNAHGGFLAGLCVYLAYLGLRGAEAYLHRGPAAMGLLRRFGLMATAAVAATFLNPYGPLFHVWLFGDLRVPRPEIVEWRSPELFNATFLPFWLLAAAAIGSVVFSKRSRDVTQVTILVLILWQAMMHHRHIAFFAIAVGWWLPLHFDSLFVRLGIGPRFKTDEELRYGWSPSQSSAFCAAFAPRVQQFMALMLVVAICASAGQLATRLRGVRVDAGQFPLSAVDYVARRGLAGKMVVTFNWAQYALAALGPREPQQPGVLVHIDGRCRTSYSQEMLDAHFDFILGAPDPQQRYRDPRSGPFDPTRVLREGQPDLVLISRLQGPSVKTMQAQKDTWVLLYQDGLAQLWGRADRYDDPASPYYVEPRYREIGDSPQHGYARWPALPHYAPKASDDSVRTIAGGGEGARKPGDS